MSTNTEPKTSPPVQLWKSHKNLILASTSQARRALFAEHGLQVDLEKPMLHERETEKLFWQNNPCGTPEDLALHLAKAKALSVVSKDRWVLAADQVLSCNGQLIHKSNSRQEAIKTLKTLQGQTHQLHSAYACAKNGSIVFCGLETASLTMKALSQEHIEDYLNRAGEGILSSVGCYQIEGEGIALMQSIQGTRETIMGLPLQKCLTDLKVYGFFEENDHE